LDAEGRQKLEGSDRSKPCEASFLRCGGCHGDVEKLKTIRPKSGQLERW
jgi:hypothetical protein